MSSFRIRIIQLGDLHYPQTSGDQGADNDGFTTVQVEATTSPRVKKVVEQVAAMREEETIIAICGDLTDRGDIEGYERGVQYLCAVLQLQSMGGQVLAVPGNHDIDRTAVAPGETDLFKKFSPLIDVWESTAAGLFDPTTVRRVDAPLGDTSLPLLALNTCILCWEYRRIPESWQVAARTLLDAHLESALVESLIEQLSQLQVDAPAVYDEHVETVSEVAKQSLTACVVVGHHALLPQARPRMEINGEPVNAGRLRTELLRVESPAIYLHGHLHDDPVECISNPPEGQFLVSIGAPELKDGFNIVDLFFSATASFLGVELHEYRFKQERLELARSRRIPYADLEPERLMTLRKLAHLFEVGETLTVQDIRIRIVRHDLSDDIDMSDESIQGALEESDWAGLLVVDDKNGAALDEWRIDA